MAVERFPAVLTNFVGSYDIQEYLWPSNFDNEYNLWPGIRLQIARHRHFKRSDNQGQPAYVYAQKSAIEESK